MFDNFYICLLCFNCQRNNYYTCNYIVLYNISTTKITLTTYYGTVTMRVCYLAKVYLPFYHLFCIMFLSYSQGKPQKKFLS